MCCAITPRMREALINDERLQKADFGFSSLRKTNGTLDPIMHSVYHCSQFAA